MSVRTEDSGPAGHELRLRLRRVAEAVAREAADLVRSARRADVSVLRVKSSPTDAVTEIDLRAEALIRERLGAARPGDGVLGEEGQETGTTTGITWVVDPIDGTVNFLYDRPAYAVSVAAVSGGADPSSWTLEAACVVDVALGTVYTAARDLGAARDGEPLTARPRADQLRMALVGTGFSYLPQTRREQARILSALLPEVRDVRRSGSAALDLCHVADGRLDAYYERGLKPWDWAGGVLVCEEAGIKVVGPDSRRPGERLTLAAPAILVDPLRRLVVAGRPTPPG
jgi:myo-inositol-1(or 4)-monophosphatase